MVHEDDPAIVVIERGARCAVSAPVRVLDGSGRVIVIVVLRQMDVRRRQQCRDDSRGDEQRGANRPAETEQDHAGILA